MCETMEEVMRAVRDFVREYDAKHLAAQMDLEHELEQRNTPAAFIEQVRQMYWDLREERFLQFRNTQRAQDSSSCTV